MNDSTETTLKSFDGTPIAASLFLRHIGEYAAKKGFLNLLLRSYYVSKHDQIVVATADLIPVIRQHFHSPAEFPFTDDIQNPPDPPVAATRERPHVRAHGS